MWELFANCAVMRAKLKTCRKLEEPLWNIVNFPIFRKKGTFHLKSLGTNEHAMWELLPCRIFQFDQVT